MQQAATDPRDADSSAVPTRSAAVESLLAEGELIETLQNQHVVDLYTFDEELGPLAGRFPTRYVPPGTASPAAVDDAVSSDSPDVDWPSLLQPRGLSTRLGDALDALLAEAKSPTLSGVVLFTDGVNNAGRGLERARERARKQGVPLIAVGVGSTRPPVNASIVRIIAPTDVQKGDAFEIAAFVQASHLSGQSAAVELLQRHAEEEDFTVIAREDIVLPDEDDVVELSFERSTLEAGEFEYQVRIDVPGVVETRREDNAGIRQVNVFDRPLKVLVVAGGPMRDFRFAKNTLYRHRAMEVDLWLQTGEVGISQEANDLLFRFPEKREDLFQYDVLLAFDPDWTAISDEQQKWIEEWVSNEGGGVLFVAGDVYTPYLAAGADNEGLAAIQRLLPVVLDEVGLQLGARSRADTAYPVQLTQEGAAAEFLRLRDSAEDAPESVDPWQEFRGVFRSYPTRGRKAGTTVYAEFTDPLSRGADGQPVLIGGLRYGQGTTLFLGSPEMWRLRAVDEDVFDRFWIKLVRNVGGGIVGLEEDTISIELIDPNGRPTIPPPTLRRDPRRPAEYVGDFRASLPGRYRLELEVPQSTDRVTTEVQVQLPRLEVAQLTQDQRALQTLTDGTGGRYLPIESAADQLPSLLPNSGQSIVIEQRIRELWDRQWVLFLLADRSYVSESQKEFSHMQKDRERRHLDELIGKVRGRIRRYLFLEGLASLVTLVCVLFWVTWACDVLYFEVRKLELPLWFRMGCTIVMACLVTWGILRALVFPALRGMRATSLALLLERQFPQLDDRLITAIELGSSSASSAPPLYQSMLSRTVGEASQMMDSLDLSRLFDFAPLRQAVVAAVVMLVSVGLFGATHAQGMGRWVEAYLLAKPDYWEPYRQSALSVHVVAQPGDRRRDFDDRGVYKHPRGADLEVIAEALPETTPPSEVILQFLGFGGAGTTRGRATMTQVGESRFRHSIARIVDNHNLWLQGGDYVNREPFRVVVVDPPQVTDVRLHCDYPSYTGLDSVEDVPVVVAGTQVSLPMETRFELVATANKPLKRVHVRSPRLEVSWGREASEDVEADAPIEVLIRDDENGDVRALHLADSPELALLTDNAEWPLPLPADTPLQIYLEDEDDIYSMDPAMVTINGIRDLDPVLDVQLSGVRSSITRTATIPFEGRLTDDYGVERGWFTYRIDESEEAEERAFKRPPTGQKEFRLDGTPEAPPAVEQFNVLPLELREGQKLAIVLHAEDGDRLNGPHHGRSNVFAFEIVSKEELLGQLFDREVNLRLRFEQMRSEISQLKDDLGERVGATASEGAETDEAARSQQLTLLAAAERSLHQLRKNHTESRAIEVSFEDLRTEMVNTRVDTADLLSRIDDGILRPLGILNTEDFLETDRRLGVFRLVAERGGDTGPAIEESIAAIDIVLERIDRILAEMRDR
ncbi:VWFA domain-containing protein, partial [Durusdinium trenchii]